MTVIQLVDAHDPAEFIHNPALNVNAGMMQIFEHLGQKGLRPKIKNDNALSFKCEGWSVNLHAYAND